MCLCEHELPTQLRFYAGWRLTSRRDVDNRRRLAEVDSMNCKANVRLNLSFVASMILEVGCEKQEARAECSTKRKASRQESDGPEDTGRLSEHYSMPTEDCSLQAQKSLVSRV